jgi:hypothetical protein
MREMLKENKTLTIINLFNNSVKNEGFSQIVNGICENKYSSILSL